MEGAFKPEIGEEYIFYIGVDDVLLPPYTTLHVKEDAVVTGGNFAPDEDINSRQTTKNTVISYTVDEYLEKIKSELE